MLASTTLGEKVGFGVQSFDCALASATLGKAGFGVVVVGVGGSGLGHEESPTAKGCII